MTEEDIPDWKKRLQRMDEAVGRKKRTKEKRCKKCQSVLRQKKGKQNWFRINPDLCFNCTRREKYE